MIIWTLFIKTRFIFCCIFDYFRRFRVSDLELFVFFFFILVIWFIIRLERECKRVKSSGNLFWGKRVIMIFFRKTYINRLLSFWCWNMSNIRLVLIRIVFVFMRCRKLFIKYRNYKICKNFILLLNGWIKL